MLRGDPQRGGGEAPPAARLLGRAPGPPHARRLRGRHPPQRYYLSGGSTASASFTPAGLQYGYNMRNLTALLMLDRMRSLP
ncbi:MAG: hypothetical protein IPN17_16785 [Deltaproteobacteria bacterium]|nr:hypothetical protein [Deltaproteobacteria bacterium]